ncbi:MAG: hypothetical protein EXQ88_07070 [Alphaproteobacteria bacterium]|nr:hypothetical protein [Alphaproteobacteria bacterium]
MHKARSAAVLALFAFAVTGAACAQTTPSSKSFFPPIVELSIAEVSSTPLADGRFRVTIKGTLINSSGSDLPKLDLRLVDAVTITPGQVLEAFALGDLKPGELRPISWSLDSYRLYEADDGLGSVIFGTSTDRGGRHRAVWVNARPIATR